MTKNKKKVSALLILAMASALIGCGNTTPAINEDVVESTESTEIIAENAVETETEVKNEEISVTETPAGISSAVQATSTPDPATEPTPEQSVAPRSTPEPTSEPPHVHDYKVESSVAATCATEGKVVKICSCGEKTEEILPVVDTHNWVEITTIVHHDSLGHTETVEEQVQVGTTETRHEYECAYCGEKFDTVEAEDEHQKASGDFNHAFARTIIHDYPGEPIYETQTKTIWVVDQEAYDTVEVVGYKCSVCGATK